MMCGVGSKSSPAEVIEGDRRVTRRGEPLGDLDVEAVEAAVVRQQDDGRAARLGRLGERGGELGAVGGAQGQGLRSGATGDRSQRAAGGQFRRSRIVVEAHRRSLLR
jgi:hypothetical protein